MNRVKIVYCTQCGWLPRSTWIAQELLNTFSVEINELVLNPSSGGVFEIYANDKRVWSRKDNEGFPELKVLKRLIRDEIAPEKDLGHTDRE